MLGSTPTAHIASNPPVCSFSSTPKPSPPLSLPKSPPPSVTTTEPLTVIGNNIYKSVSNTIWSGKGADLQDTRACGVGCDRSKEEVKRRIDYLFDVANLDWIRLTLESDDVSSEVINDSSYWSDIQDIVAYIGTKPGKYVEVTIWHDPSLGEDPSAPGGSLWRYSTRMGFHDECFQKSTSYYNRSCQRTTGESEQYIRVAIFAQFHGLYGKEYTCNRSK